MLPSLLKRNVFVGHPALPFIRVTVLLVAQFLQHPEPSSGESPPTRSGHGSATTYPPPIGWTRVDEQAAGEQSPMTFTAKLGGNGLPAAAGPWMGSSNW